MIAIIIGIYSHISTLALVGTIIAAAIASFSSYARSHYETQKYVRFAIRARLAKKAEPDFDRLARHFRSTHLSGIIPRSSHPSPEITEALHLAEKQMGMRQGSTMALVVPLELILGVEHNCPSAAAMLYANRHPVILIDDHLQALLDSPDDHKSAFDIAVAVLCHELAHLIGWNTRWNRVTSLSELFIATVAMTAIVVDGLSHSVVFGAIGAFIAIMRLTIEPIAKRENSWGTFIGITARMSYVVWFPYIIAGIISGYLSFLLVLNVSVISIGFKMIIAYLRRKEELFADSISAQAIGSSSPLANFFRTLPNEKKRGYLNLFSTHPSIHDRIHNLRHSNI